MLNSSWVQSAVSSGYEVNGEKKYRRVSFPLPFYPETVSHPCDACPVGTFESGKTLSDALADIADITDNGAVKEELLKIKRI